MTSLAGRQGISLAEALVTAVRLVQILRRPDGNDAVRVDGGVAAVVVVANVRQADRLGDARHLVDVAQETVQVQVVADAVFVALEVGDVHRIEANQRGPQTQIGFGQPIAGQVAVLPRDLPVRSSALKTPLTASSYASSLVAKPALYTPLFT